MSAVVDDDDDKDADEEDEQQPPDLGGAPGTSHVARHVVGAGWLRRLVRAIDKFGEATIDVAREQGWRTSPSARRHCAVGPGAGAHRMQAPRLHHPPCRVERERTSSCLAKYADPCGAHAADGPAGAAGNPGVNLWASSPT